MRLHHIGLAAVAAGVMASATPARAADIAATDPSAVQAPIKGADVMGDKGRTGPDGWSWAPQTRDQAPGDKNNQTAANGRGDANSAPNPSQGKKMAPGDDPGTPAATDAHGPGTTDSGAGSKP